jgi:hypothetical protein
VTVPTRRGLRFHSCWQAQPPLSLKCDNELAAAVAPNSNLSSLRHGHATHGGGLRRHEHAVASDRRRRSPPLPLGADFGTASFHVHPFPDSTSGSQGRRSPLGWPRWYAAAAVLGNSGFLLLANAITVGSPKSADSRCRSLEIAFRRLSLRAAAAPVRCRTSSLGGDILGRQGGWRVAPPRLRHLWRSRLDASLTLCSGVVSNAQATAQAWHTCTCLSSVRDRRPTRRAHGGGAHRDEGEAAAADARPWPELSHCRSDQERRRPLPLVRTVPP